MIKKLWKITFINQEDKKRVLEEYHITINFSLLRIKLLMESWNDIVPLTVHIEQTAIDIKKLKERKFSCNGKVRIFFSEKGTTGVK